MLDAALDWHAQMDSFLRTDDTANIATALTRVFAERPREKYSDMALHALKEWTPCKRRLELPN